MGAQTTDMAVIVVGVAAAVALVAVVYLGLVGLILKAMPRDVRLVPADAKLVSRHMLGVMDRYEAAGFTLAGPAYEVQALPKAILVPMVHRSGEAYATFYRVGTTPTKTSWDIVTILEGGGLTTTAEPVAGAMPAARGALMQVFQNAPIDRLAEQHFDAVAYVKGEGIRVIPATADAFEGAFRDAMNQQRGSFIRGLPFSPLIVLFRPATGTTPHIGSIRHQRAAAKTLRKLRPFG